MSDRVLRFVQERCYCKSGSVRGHSSSLDDHYHQHHHHRHHDHSGYERRMPKLKSFLEEDDEADLADDEAGVINSKTFRRKSEPIGESTSNIFKAATTPFELPHVFREILQYLPLQDWKNCRLVNRTWLEACPKPFSSNSFQFVIPDEQGVQAIVSGKVVWGRKPIQSGMFQDVKLPSGVTLRNKYLKSFLDKFGRYIKCIVVPDGWTIAGLQNILFDQCVNLEGLHLIGKVPRGNHRVICAGPSSTHGRPKLPKLKKFIFELVNVHMDLHEAAVLVPPPPPGFINSTNPIAKLLLGDLLSLAPNLEWVQCPTRRDLKRDSTLCHKIATLHGISTSDVDNSFNRVNQFLAQKLFSFAHDCNPKITGLQLYLRLNARGMDKLAMKRYPLQKIDLHIRSGDKQGLMDLLPQLGTTLQNLRLTVDNKFHFDFPCGFLTELHTLYLEDYAGDLQFIGDIPKLKSLTLGFFNCNMLIKTAAATTVPCVNSNLKSLTLENLLLPEQQSRCIKRLSTVFPNLVKFHLNNVNDKDLLKIYDCFPQLEELHLSCCNVTHVGITGFMDSDTETILDAGYEQNKFEEYENLRRMPYIGNLQGLKSLSLTGQVNLSASRFPSGRMMNTLQSLSILHGFCSLKNLRNLTLHDATISAIEMKQLIRTLNLARLEFVDCRIDSAVLGWVQKKLRDKALEFINRKTD